MELLWSTKLALVMTVMILFTCINTDKVMGMTVCNMKQEGLDACKPAVSGSNPPPPTPYCCDSSKGADVNCFCKYKSSLALKAMGIDGNQATRLPGKCGLPPANC
ncbi:hypothetical protein LUZ60_002549 [Juncus effusus]|nr:hypothetical protein LUZ60_002549 [Juncus effusus]